MTQSSTTIAIDSTTATDNAPAATSEDFLARLKARREACFKALQAATPKRVVDAVVTGKAVTGHIEVHRSATPGPKQHLVLLPAPETRRPAEPANSTTPKSAAPAPSKAEGKSNLPPEWQVGYRLEGKRDFGIGTGLSRFVDAKKVAERSQRKEQERRETEQRRRIAEAANLAARAQEKARKAAETEAREAKKKTRQGGKKHSK